jgi:hypothetical protein
MNEITRIRSDLAQGPAHTAGQLLPLVSKELRKLAARSAASAGASKGVTPGGSIKLGSSVV